MRRNIRRMSRSILAANNRTIIDGFSSVSDDHDEARYPIIPDVLGFDAASGTVASTASGAAARRLRCPGAAPRSRRCARRRRRRGAARLAFAYAGTPRRRGPSRCYAWGGGGDTTRGRGGGGRRRFERRGGGRDENETTPAAVGQSPPWTSRSVRTTTRWSCRWLAGRMTRLRRRGRRRASPRLAALSGRPRAGHLPRRPARGARGDGAGGDPRGGGVGADGRVADTARGGGGIMTGGGGGDGGRRGRIRPRGRGVMLFSASRLTSRT